jgi:hypothetical protein
MSWVSNAVVFIPCGEKDKDRLDEVNAALVGQGKYNQEFIASTDLSVGTEWYGGHKCMEMDMWAAAFNYIGLERVLEALEAADWKYPQGVVLMWADQEDTFWSVHKLGEIR